MRIVGFQDSMRKRFSSFEKDTSSVLLEHCKIKRARPSEDLEILLNSTTILAKSPQKFNVSSVPDNIVLKDLVQYKIDDRVTFNAKVIAIENPQKVSHGLTKQEIVVADATAAAHLTLWENDVGSLEKNKSYFFKNMKVTSFRSEKYVVKPKYNGSIEAIDDIGEVSEDNLSNDTISLSGAEIVGIIGGLQIYSACITCNTKVDVIDDQKVYCSKCEMIFKRSKSHQNISARLCIETNGDYIVLSAFTDILKAIVGSDEVSEDSLFATKPFNLCYANSIIVSVERK